MDKLSLDKTLSTILIIIIIIAVAATVYIIVFPQPSEEFTEFYILGPDGKAGNYPTNLTVGSSGQVIIGIVNHENKDMTYQLQVKLNRNILKNENITLKNGEKKEIPFTFTPPGTVRNQTLEFLLYKLPDNGTVYRSLHLYIDVT